jgi:Flp pilus assembly protein TadB
VNRPEIRIGDVERDAAVAALGDHYAAGRLSKEEYDERSEVAWKARTNSDLAPLFYDLPPLRQQERLTGPATHDGSSRDRTRRQRPPVLPVLLLVVVVAAVAGLEIWPFLLLFAVYLWLRVWIGMGRLRRWTQRAHQSTSVEPWRHHGRPGR